MGSINSKMAELGKVRSVIRETFEYGNKRKKEIGKENVFDFSLGNPSIPAPQSVDESIRELTNNVDSTLLHGYTSAQGAEDVRAAIAENIKDRFGVNVGKEYIYMTCGAAASLTICLNALVCAGDEVIAFAPFFPEYRVFAENAGASFVCVDADTGEFQINFEDFIKKVGPHTKAVILNSPNNPTGAVISEKNIIRLCDILNKKSEEYAHPIYLISDEPYRELVYDDIKVPYLMNYYKNTLVCYSFSKSLSLPGERIGYIALAPEIDEKDDVYAAVCGAGRALGFVCAPSMMQRVIAANLGKTSDMSVYKKNRDILFDALTQYGYDCVHPDGAFYLFVKALEDDANKFCEKAREFELLLVPSDSFGTEGYVRISYCVTTEMINRSLPAFKKLAEIYK